MDKPYILEIKCNSLDDGPGIRSVVFFKGCPLRCIWCHNPESKRPESEISYDASECIHCGRCIQSCPAGALSPENEFFVDRIKCTLCYKCTEGCPAKALTRVGCDANEDEILKKLLSDKPFYDVSGGGVTFSGGEATMFSPWVGGLAKRLCESGVNVLLETCGMFSYDRVSMHLLPYVKDIYCDIKIFDSAKHMEYCGVDNSAILENIRRMKRDEGLYGYRLLPRIPLIPGITDTDENLGAIAGFMSSCGIDKTDLLPYNPTWYSKNFKLGIEKDSRLNGLDGWQSKEKIEHCRQIFLNKNIQC